MDILNNKIILLRKSLKSIINQTKLNLIKKIKNDKDKNKNVERKESELLCFTNNKIKPSDVPLSKGLFPDELQKILTNSNSIEIDRVHARILTNRIIQKTLIALKDKYGIERVEKFLKQNEKKVKKSSAKRILDDVKLDKSTKDSKISKNKEDNDTNIKSKKNRATDESKNEQRRTPSTTKSLDPFFLDSTGENYLASVTTALSDSESSEKEELKPKQRLQTGNNKKFSDKKRNVKPALLKRDQHDAKKIIKEVPCHIQSKEDELHPSWKAKQQMKKVQIQEFKGTKIKFDD